MDVSYAGLLEAAPNECNEFLFKRKLMQYKKDGLLFFTKDIAELTDQDCLSVHFCLFPNKQTTKDAFPVPTRLLQYHKSEMSQYLYLKNFFESYYEEAFDLETFYTYDSYHPYVGNLYSWYQKKPQCL